MPDDFSWVKERHACSIIAVFKSLEVAAEKDVKARNDLKSEGDQFGFKFQEQRNGSFFVERLANRGASYVVFNLKDSFISVCGPDGKEMFRATPTLTNDRECRLKVNGEELEVWQIMRKALEALFFEN